MCLFVVVAEEYRDKWSKARIRRLYKHGRVTVHLALPGMCYRVNVRMCYRVGECAYVLSSRCMCVCAIE